MAQHETGRAETPWDSLPTDPPLIAIRRYRCMNCWTEKDIRTDHTGMCYNYCFGCSGRPWFGRPEYAIKIEGLGDHTYRPFKLAEPPELEEERRREAAGRLKLTEEDIYLLGGMKVKAS